MSTPAKGASPEGAASINSRSTGIDYSKWDNFEESADDDDDDSTAEKEPEVTPIVETSHQHAKKDNAGAEGIDQDGKNRRFLHESKRFQDQYMSQHCSNGDGIISATNSMFDTLAHSGTLTILAPSYRSGINPNYFEEYFSELEPNDFTNTAECKISMWDEYEQRRWSYCQHLAGYHAGTIQNTDRDFETVELWRRFGLRARPPHYIIEWYVNNRRKIGDVLHVRETIRYLVGVSDVLHQSFSNCPVDPKQTLTFGTVHVAVGFVDLGLLLDSRFLGADSPDSQPACLLFRGFEASSFCVAKSLVLWEMVCTSGTKASWLVQVWFSTVWSKRATNSFLAAARRVASTHCSSASNDYPQGVCQLVHHWSRSKGVGLKKLIRRRSNLRNESSDALFFARKEDRREMIRYHLTGAFGLSGEQPCSSSILMFDCPPASVVHEAASVFETLTLDDVVSSDLYNGSYFQTAEKVKERRVSALLSNAQKGLINVQLSVSFLTPNSQVLEEIARLQPSTVSWSNVLDYMPPGEFHELAKTCSATAVHSGYSMNWPGIVYGSSLIDYPSASLNIIRDAEKKTSAALRTLCQGRRIFLTPIQSNPLNITAGFLAEKCHQHWLEHFFGMVDVRILEAGMLEDCSSLSRVSVVVASSWTYNS